MPVKGVVKATVAEGASPEEKDTECDTHSRRSGKRREGDV